MFYPAPASNPSTTLGSSGEIEYEVIAMLQRRIYETMDWVDINKDPAQFKRDMVGVLRNDSMTVAAVRLVLSRVNRLLYDSTVNSGVFFTIHGRGEVDDWVMVETVPGLGPQSDNEGIFNQLDFIFQLLKTMEPFNPMSATVFSSRVVEFN